MMALNRFLEKHAIPHTELHKDSGVYKGQIKILNLATRVRNKYQYDFDGDITDMKI